MSNTKTKLLALGAIRVAERIIHALDSRKIDDIDVESEIQRLRQIASLGDQIRDSYSNSEIPEKVIIRNGKKIF